MILEILKFGNPILRKKSTIVEEINEEILELMDNMVETMYDAPGVGLAAPQIGVNKRIFVIDVGGTLKKIINPEFIAYSEEAEVSEEGCLSIPNIYEKVKRPIAVKIKYMNEKGEVIEEEAEELYARALQHEADHLDAVLFVDKVSPLTKKLIKKKLTKLSKETLKNLKKG